VATAAVGIPVVLALIYAGGWYLQGAVALLILLGLREYYRLARDAGRRVIPAIGYLVALPVALTPPRYQLIPTLALLLVWASVELTRLAISFFRSPKTRLTETLQAHQANATIFGLVYVAWTLAHVTLLRGSRTDAVLLFGRHLVVTGGACWLFLVFATCWGMDTAAYSVGKMWGRRKLCPKISPGKTVEGSIAALFAAVLIVSGLGWWFGSLLWQWQAALLGVILGVVGQLGDLSESKLKRWAGVKDSGAILPGHGGILDRFDSLLFCAPVAYYYLRIVVGG
jgi:phosphatidate cytidylyltransferase